MATSTLLTDNTTTLEGSFSGRLPLTAQDRCDACGAQAYLAVTLYGTEMFYCSHHANKFELKLRELATSWHDERSKLYASK